MVPGRQSRADADAGAGHDQPGEQRVGAALFEGVVLVGHRFIREHGDQLAQTADTEDGDAGYE